MAKLTSENFVDLVRRSELVEAVDLDRALDESRNAHGGKLPEDAADLADELIEKGLLTRWHCDKLLTGKYKGFYLDKYKLLRLLGTGGMSAVYLAEHMKMHRLVAVKVLPKSRVNDSSYLERFYREGQAAAALDHPNIVRAFDIDNQDTTHYLIMEYVEGQDLQLLVKEKGPLDFELAASYIAQAAEGLEHAHENNIIHRDIKPANLLVDGKGVVKILDMGLARFSNEDKASLTIAYDENVLGTADYLAPEQALDSHGVDLRVDIYSLGCTFYYLLTGHPPFPEGTLAQRIAKHQTTMPAEIATERPKCPPVLVDICNKMMRKKAKRRYQSAAEVSEAIYAWLAVPVGPGKVAGGGGRSPGGSDAPGRSRDSARSPADTISDQSGETKKGLDEGSDRRRNLRVAKPLESEDSWRTDSGSIDLGLEDFGPLPSPSGDKTPSFLLKRNRRASRFSSTWWIWIALALGMLVAVILMIVVARAFGAGSESSRATHPPAPPTAMVASDHGSLGDSLGRAAGRPLGSRISDGGYLGVRSDS